MKKKHKQTLIKKASGEEELFSVEKLKQSLLKAGAERKISEDIIREIETWIYDGISTKLIYRKAFSMLQKQRNQLAARYKLKNAILELGPTGYPFEFFIGQILESQGYETETGKILQGRCISHEVDVIATKEKTICFIECKFHQDQGRFTNVQVPLYIRSRVDDLISKYRTTSGYEDFSYEGWVVTNTRFSKDALEYGKCAGLKLLGWDYPDGYGLKEMIDRKKIFPITVLTTLKKAQKQQLLEKGIVICRQILQKPSSIDFLKLTDKQKANLLRSLTDLCGP